MDLETLPQLRSLNLSGTLVKLEMLPAKHLQNLSEMDLSNQKFRGSHLNLLQRLPPPEVTYIEGFGF